jgi:hypothetical protein
MHGAPTTEADATVRSVLRKLDLDLDRYATVQVRRMCGRPWPARAASHRIPEDATARTEN